MKKDGGLISDWQLVPAHAGVVYEDQLMGEPEPMELRGTVIEDSAGRFQPGDLIRTSIVVFVDRALGIVATQNTIYKVINEITDEKYIYHIYRSKEELGGNTNVIGFAPGKFNNDWLPLGAVYVDDEAFKYFAPVILKHCPDVDSMDLHYDTTDISRKVGLKIADDWRIEATKTKAPVARMLIGLAEHIEKILAREDYFCVLGV